MTSIKTYKEKYHFSVNFYSIFLLFTFIPDIIHTDNLVFKYAFWALKMILACWVILKTKQTFIHFTPVEFLYLIVFIIYTTYMYIDVFVNPRPIVKYSQGVVDFTGFCIVLFLALSFRYDAAYHSEKSFRFFWISLTIGLIIAYFMAIEDYELDIYNLRFDANSTVNSIIYGQMGCALGLISIFGFINTQKKLQRVLFVITFFIGLISIAKAGSRSPLLAMVLAIIFYFTLRFNTLKTLLIIGIVFGLFMLFLHPIIELLNSMGSSLAVRLEKAFMESDTSGRDDIWRNVMSLISKSPVFGVYYLIPFGVGSGSYPHNYFLEVFMATGLIGGIPFIILVLITLAKARTLIRINHPSTWIIILYLQVLVYGNFSTGLYTSQDFWILVFFICSIKISTQEKQSPYLNHAQLI